MRYLLLSVVIALPALAAADVAPWSSQQVYRVQLESLYRCQWLAAASDEEQEQQQENKAAEEEEPDCD